MIEPISAWPRPKGFDDSLSEIIASGDVAQAREHFNKVFWDNVQDRPGWKHLRLAVLREDRAMVKLLATWGAHPTEDELSHFRAVTGEKYGSYVKLMRQGGLRSNGQPWEDITPATGVKETADDLIVKSFADNRFTGYTLDKLPREWLKVLGGFQAAGADELIIAGGALRDTYNSRPVKDVDIFLRSQGSEKKNRKFMQAAFAAAGIEVKPQEFQSSDGYSTTTRSEMFPSPSSQTHDVQDGSSKNRKREMQSWKVLAGPHKTEYNIIFVDDNLDRALMKTATKNEGKSIFAGALLAAFDTGLSQIATDGNEIVSTPEYKNDVLHKRISLIAGRETSEDHLKRIVAKYGDFEQSAELKAALAPKPKPPRSRSSGYDWY